MTGYNTVLKIRSLEEQINKLGFKWGHARHGGYGNEYGNVVALTPKDEIALPVYARDAEVFIGTIEELEVWLRGLQWARSYDHMLGVANEKKRTDREEKYRKEMAEARAKREKKQVWDILSDVKKADEHEV